MPATEILTVLADGALRLKGRFVWGSNHTFLVQLEHAGASLKAVYKPQAGEIPLWDFPAGTLAAREVAAWLTSEALGWQLVPPTVLRSDAPAGPGSVQLFLDLDPERHFFTFSDDERARLRPVAAFDALVNNADRKAGHILLGPDDHIWLIDHGVCFHHHDKLRTVVWDFAGEPIPDPLLADMQRLERDLAPGQSLETALLELLEPVEVHALRARAASLLTRRTFPRPGPDRPYPWPLV